MKVAVTAADEARAARLVAELEADGKLSDPRKALLIALAQSFATFRALSKRKAAAAKGDRIQLRDGTVIRAQRSVDELSIYLTEPGRPERPLVTMGQPKVRAA